MTPAEYTATILTMENQNTDAIRERMIDRRTIRMLHAAIGMCTETGEIQDQLKKALIYGKPLDYVNMVEELGDALWYFALMCDVLQVSFEHVMELNIAKLRKRYPDGYSHERALNRNLKVERSELAKGRSSGGDRLDVADLVGNLAAAGLPVIVIDDEEADLEGWETNGAD